MASNALIWNPLNEKNDRLLVYYNSTKGNLGLRQWSTGDDGWGPVWAEKEESAKGNLKVGGGLTALRWRDWIRVYGIVTVKDAKEGKNIDYLSLLSPVIQSLSVKTYHSRLTGTGNGKDKAWLYYLTGAEHPVINERATDNSSTKPINKDQKLLYKADPPAVTNLASAYTHKNRKRYVFFQTENKAIHITDVDGNKDVEVTADARAGTPLAATSFIHGEQEFLVVYFARETDNALARAHILSGSATAKWSAKTLDGAGSPTQETLSVAPNTTSLQNVVVFSADDNTEPQIYTDDWDAIINPSA